MPNEFYTLIKYTLCKWGHFERAKMTLKILPASWFFVYLFKRLRSFNTVSIWSLGQRAEKLLSFKFWERFDPGGSRTWADWLKWDRGRAGNFYSNFKDLWSTDFNLQYLKIQNFQNSIQKSRGWKHLKGHFCSLKETSFT